jgi:organic hydroperoxide reductase OsmC/OhrA
MQPYPHAYRASAGGSQRGIVTVASPALSNLETAPPPEFGGPGGIWSPETLLCATLAVCFILTFRGISRAARAEWIDLECHVEGTLDRVEGASRFTHFKILARLTVPPETDVEKVRSLLERSEQTCLISNSLRAERHLESEIVTSTSA